MFNILHIIYDSQKITGGVSYYWPNVLGDKMKAQRLVTFPGRNGLWVINLPSAKVDLAHDGTCVSLYFEPVG